MSAGSSSSDFIPGFDLNALQRAAEVHFGSNCLELNKIGEGAYHKVFLLRLDHLTSKVVEVVARVAKPNFPRDKVESEIATFRYLASHTKLPVPKVYAWNSDATNPVGAEYMFVEKVRGVDTSTVWDHLDLSAKLVFVEDLATYLHEIFLHRFDKAGSLYLVSSRNDSKEDCSDDLTFTIGPIVSAPFYLNEDRSPVSSPPHRGPYSTVFEFLASWPETELAYLEEHPQEAMRWFADHGRQTYPAAAFSDEAITAKYVCCIEVLRTHLQSSLIYGALPLSTPDPDPVFSASVFTLYLDDLNLSNLMINPLSGHITAFIDLEGSFTAPLWLVTPLPRWLRRHGSGEEIDDDSSGEVEPEVRDTEAYEEGVLRKAFLSRMNQLDLAGAPPRWSCLTSTPTSLSYRGFAENAFDGGKYMSGQWVRALKDGALYRRAWHNYGLGWPTRGSQYDLNHAESLLDWARSHPGVPRPASPDWDNYEDSDSSTSEEGSINGDSEGSDAKHDGGSEGGDARVSCGEVGSVVTGIETHLVLEEAVAR